MEHLDTALIIALLAWLGKRFVLQIDKLSESVANLAIQVGRLQVGQEALERQVYHEQQPIKLG